MTVPPPTRPIAVRAAVPRPGLIGPARPAPDAPSDGRRLLTIVVGVGAAAVTVGFAWVLHQGSYDAYAAALVALVLFAASVPLARHAARVERWPMFALVFMVAVALKLAGALARYQVAYGLYGGVADASTYTKVATSNYDAFRHLHLFAPTTGVFHGLVPFLDTVIYALAGPTELGSFLVFSWIGLVGQYLFYRAFRIAYPDGDGRRYAVLVFFLPSMLYWPSSLGKEAWMVFALGLACYGLARALAGRYGGYLCLSGGIGAMLLVRPHLALIWLPAASLAFLFRSRGGGRHRPVGRLVGIAVLALASLVVVAKAQSYFGITSLDPQTINQELTTTQDQTAIGNSAFHPPNAQSPLGYPEAVVTVLFRPFPFEAHGLTVLVASGEGVVLGLLTIGSWRRLRRLPQALWRNPYLIFCLTYSALFILAFASFSNFGILACERVQMFPLFLVLLAVPARATTPSAPPDTGEGGADGDGGHRRPRRPDPVAAPRPVGLRPVPRRSALRPAVTTHSALGHHFALEVDARLAPRRISDLFSGLPAGAGPQRHYRLAAVDDRDGLLARLDVDGHPGQTALPVADAVAALAAAVHDAAVSSRYHHLILHAAAVARPGGALLLPGASGAGKSTLCASLVQRGWAYLTDEAAAVDADDLVVAPYAKPLALDPSSLRALGLPPGDVSGGETLVAPGRLGPGPPGRPAPASLIVFPRYLDGSGVELRPMDRAEAVVAMAAQAFTFHGDGPAHLETLGRLVARCRCFTVTFGDVAAAADVVGDLDAGAIVQAGGHG